MEKKAQAKKNQTEVNNSMFMYFLAWYSIDEKLKSLKHVEKMLGIEVEQSKVIFCLQGEKIM